ncbi:hypothetical protein [Soonwooa sp.]|uniref:hypothetical protein n=1 Tax=Soonwooa sp. TaxID=1938592 RepID=UPI0026175885|nr:hypothetical protein [Soonwooa sp.]
MNQENNQSGPIPKEKALQMLKSFEEAFGGDILVDKTYRLSYNLLKGLIDQKKDLVLRFAQVDKELNLLYTDEAAKTKLLINQDVAIEVDSRASDAMRKNFDDTTKGLRPKFDQYITKMFDDASKHENTRQITIPYQNNFDAFDPQNHTGIVLQMAIDNTATDKTRLHKLTFVMYFESSFSKAGQPETYFDMMGLCPPGDCR